MHHLLSCAACADLLDGLPDNLGRWGADDERRTLDLLGSR
jgi:hypothetical protein